MSRDRKGATKDDEKIIPKVYDVRGRFTLPGSRLDEVIAELQCRAGREGGKSRRFLFGIM